MKVLFLDIDGVLNWQGTADRIGGYIGLCPMRIARLNRITDAVPGVKIVVSSTWRHCFDSEAYRDFNGLKKLLAARGVTAEIIGATPKRLSYVPRGGEIRMWLDDHRDEERRKRTRPLEPIEAIVILDDDTSGMTGYSPPPPSKWDDPEDPDTYKGSIDLRRFHVVTSWDGEDNGVEGGLQDKHVELAIKVLNGEEVPVKKNPAHPEPEWVTVTEKDLTT